MEGVKRKTLSGQFVEWGRVYPAVTAAVRTALKCGLLWWDGVFSSLEQPPGIGL